MCFIRNANEIVKSQGLLSTYNDLIVELQLFVIWLVGRSTER